MSQQNKYNYRAATLYVVQEQDKTAEAIAEEVLFREIIKQYPAIEQVEADYQNGRAKLNDEAKAGLKRPA